MLTKPLAHLRPLLRLPSQNSLPADFFTSNPSILHHLHPNNAIVPTGQSSAQAAGSAGNAGASGAGTGRTGWGAGTGSGSGYTGHARAFLALQTTSSIDPSTVLNSNSEENRSRKQSILSQHRLNRRTQIVDIESENVGRTVHRQIEARTGGFVDVVELEGRKDESRLLDNGEGTRGRRRSSIAFPNRTIREPATPPRVASPVRSRQATPTRSSERSLPRSQSSLDIWHVGMPQSRLSMRTMSTSSPSIPLPEVDEIEAPIVLREAPPSTRILGQPNRVLMDLAGVDLPGRPAKSSLVRRNSTAAIQQSEAIPELGASAEESPLEGAPSTSRSGKVDLDKQFFTKLYQSLHGQNRHSFHHLVEVYRSPRTPENIAQLRADPDLADCPVPNAYSTATYNICLEGLLSSRQTGESIAPLLEIYNEMLDNNCIPNYKTYSIIIQALSEREIDVWRASERQEQELKWKRYGAAVLEQTFDEEAAAQQMAAIQGYQSEGNFASALKLVRASALTPKTALLPAAYLRLLIAAETRQCTPEDVEEIREILNIGYGSDRPISGNRQWHGHLMSIYAKFGDVEAVKSEWARFLELEAQDAQSDSKDLAVKWLEYEPRSVTPKDQQEIQRRRLVVWESAARAFAAVGEIDTAEELWAGLLTSSHSTDKSALPNLPPPQLSANLRFCIELCKADIDRGIAFFDHIVFQAAKVQPVQVSTGYLRPYVHLLIEAGKFDIISQIASTPYLVQNTDQSLLTTIYLYALHTARTQPERIDEALNIITLASSVKSLPFNLDVFRMHAEVVIGAQKQDQLPTVFQPYVTHSQYQPVTEDDARSLDNLVKTILSDIPLTLPVVLSLLEKANAISEISVDESIPTLIGRLYLETKAQATGEDLQSVLTPGDFENVIGYVSSYPVDDGEMDDVLVTVAQDLRAAVDPKIDYMADRVNRPAMRLFAQKLSTRVGRERTMDLLGASLGSDRVEEWIDIQRPDTPALTDGESGSEASLPSLPEHTQTTTPPSRPFTVSRSLSQVIDRHTLRNSNITPEVAYNKLKEVMASRHQVPHPDIIARLFDNLSRIPDEEKTREMYSLAHYIIQTSLPAPERTMAWLKVEDTMLIAACHLGRLEEAGMYRARILQAGMVPSADAYATMIACSKDTTDDALVARELFEESRGMGIVPNLFLYNTIISKLSKARKAEMALELFKNMKESGVRPSSVTYGAVINACCRVGDGESATVLFEEMSSQRGFRPRVPPFNTMMQFHLTTQPSRERVLHYFNLLRTFRVPPSAHTYKLLLDAYAVLQPIDLPAMERVFNDICGDSEVRVQGTHWASLISAYGISGNDLDKALQLFESIPSHPRARVDLRSEPVVWEAVLNVVAQKGSVEQMEAIRNRMIQLGARSTAYVHNVLITGYARAGLAEKAREVFASMGDSVTGVAAPNNHPQLLTSSGHVKPSTVTDRSTEIVYREPSTYESMIRAELSVGDVGAAEAVLERMGERRYPAAVFMRARHILDDYLVHQPQGTSRAVADVEASGTAGAYRMFKPMEEPPTQSGTYVAEPKVEGEVVESAQEEKKD